MAAAALLLTKTEALNLKTNINESLQLNVHISMTQFISSNLVKKN